MHLTSSPVDWYAARAAGVTAYLLLSGVVLLGLTMAAKKPFGRWPRFTVEDVHRFGGLLVGGFVAIHVVTVAIDSWLPFSLQSSSCRSSRATGRSGSASGSRRGAPGRAGRDESLQAAAAVHVLAARALPQLRRLGRGDGPRPGQRHRPERAVGARRVCDGGRRGVGRDRVACRARPPRRVDDPSRRSGRVGSVVLVVGLGIGPLHFRPRPWNAAHFSERLTGRITQLSGVSRGIVSMVGQGQGEQNVLVRADLLIAPRKLLKTSFQMEYLPSGELCTGTVTKVHPTAFAAVCRLRTGERRTISARWQAGGSADIADGLITASRF